jgi:hypothetical protein
LQGVPGRETHKHPAHFAVLLAGRLVSQAIVMRPETAQFLSTHPNPDNRESTLSALVPQMEAYYQPLADHPVHPVTIVTALN